MQGHRDCALPCHSTPNWWESTSVAWPPRCLPADTGKWNVGVINRFRDQDFLFVGVVTIGNPASTFVSVPVVANETVQA